MATRVINRNEKYSHNSGNLFVRAWAGDGHSANIVIEKNNAPIINGTDDIETNVDAQADDEIFVEGKIFLPKHESEQVSFSVDLNGSGETEPFEYTTKRLGNNVIKYKITIKLQA